MEKEGEARALIYNILGEKIGEVKGYGRAGARNQLEVDLKGYAPGVYYYILEVKKSAVRVERYKARKFAVER